MSTKAYNIRNYTRENGGRALTLLLLFFLAIYNFINSGYNAFVTVTVIPFLVLAAYVFFKY